MTGRVLELAFPSEKWARHVADALTAAGWLPSVIALDADHFRERRPDLAELLSDDLLVAHLVLAAPPVAGPLPLDLDALPAPTDRCARCGRPIDADAGPVKLAADWLCRGCLTEQESRCILDRPPSPPDPRGGDADDA